MKPYNPEITGWRDGFLGRPCTPPVLYAEDYLKGYHCGGFEREVQQTTVDTLCDEWQAAEMALAQDARRRAS
jgi:hypothetical protein